MSRRLVAHYLTQGGHDGAKVYATNAGYSYSGKWGAGCTFDPAHVAELARDWAKRRGVRVLVAFEIGP